MTTRSRARDRALTIAAAVTTVVAAAIGARRFATRHDLPPIPEEHAPASVPDWRTYGETEALAPEAAAVTVVVFSDYQCGYCASARATVASLVKEYSGAVEAVWRHYPHLGPESRNAAVAAECARIAGRFEEMHERLFAEGRDRTLGLTPWTSIALEAGVRDTARFAACLEDEAAALEAVERDVTAGRRLGVRGTPAVLVDSLLFLGRPERRWLEAYVGRRTGGNGTPQPAGGPRAWRAGDTPPTDGR